ncbi:MAG: CaiB/BaiF CoA-transferase family protein [Dehalococcoidia bacterium]
MGGALGLVGYSAEEPPVIAENLTADVTTAILQSVIGILMAICARERTGAGQLVDVSLMDGVLFTLSGIPEVAEYLMRGTVPRRGEALFGGSQPGYAVYETADHKYISLGTLEPHFWKRFCQAIGREDLIARQYAPSPVREEVFAELRSIFLSKRRDEWFDILTAADVPAGKVLDVDEAFSGPQAQHREMLIEVDHPRAGKSRQIAFPIKFSDTPWQVRIPAARLGEHTNEVLTELGYPADEIERLRGEKVIC